MGVQLFFIRIVSVIGLLLLNKPVQALVSVAKPNCQEYCGTVEIAYPFGMGSTSCFFNKWFEIDCKRTNDTGTSYMKPYLKSIGQEVIRISTEYSNKIQIRYPVNKVCKSNNNDNNTNNSSYDLKGTPFFFSDDNTFFGIGCNINAYMTDQDDNVSVWCISDNCDSPTYYNSDRCTASIQPNLQVLKPMIRSSKEEDVIISNNGTTNSTSEQRNNNECAYIFLAAKYWESDFYRLYGVNISNVPRYVPVYLDWALYDANQASFGAKNGTTLCKTKPKWFLDGNRFYSNSTLKCYCINSYDGNPYLPDGCQENYARTGRDKDKKSNWKVVVIGVCSAIGSVILVVVAWYLFKVAKKEITRRRKEKFFKRNGGLLLQQQVSSGDGNVEKTKIFTSYELEKATDHYNVNRVLGQGGQGTVFKGMLSDGRIVAVKKSKIDDSTKVEQFINEVVILSQINHRNVVKLFGCCLETEVPLLVYEFIPNGTLFKHIHDPNDDFPLTWEMRLRICVEIAGALSYLHSAASIPIYHRDIKSTNILLDDKYKARVSDFGTSKSVDIDKTHFTTLVQGTFGYLDPEYFQSSQFTEKSDVYSFGVVIVELLTGRKPIFSNEFQEIRGLASHFIEMMEEDHFTEMIDPRIVKEEKIEEIVAVAHLAKMCLHLNGKSRPTMKEVALHLEGIRMSRDNVIPQNKCEVVEIDLPEVYDGSTTSSTWSW